MILLFLKATHLEVILLRWSYMIILTLFPPRVLLATVLPWKTRMERKNTLWKNCKKEKRRRTLRRTVGVFDGASSKSSTIRGNGDEQIRRGLVVGLASIESRPSLLVNLFHALFKVSKRVLCGLTDEIIRSWSDRNDSRALEFYRRISRPPSERIVSRLN